MFEEANYNVLDLGFGFGLGFVILTFSCILYDMATLSTFLKLSNSERIWVVSACFVLIHVLFRKFVRKTSSIGLFQAKHT